MLVLYYFIVYLILKHFLLQSVSLAYFYLFKIVTYVSQWIVPHLPHLFVGLFVVKKIKGLTVTSTKPQHATTKSPKVAVDKPIPTKLFQIKKELPTTIAIEPRQFAQIGTPNFTGATIIPHATDIDEFTVEEFEQEVMDMEEIEQITFEDAEQFEDEEEEGDDNDSSHASHHDNTRKSVGKPVTAGKQQQQQRQAHNESNDSSSFHYDSSFDVDDMLKYKPPTSGRKSKEIDIGESFACRHCGKRYRWKSTLRRHERVECGGIAPSYGCPYCEYKAKQRGNLSVHMRKYHTDKPQLASTRKKKDKSGLE